MLARGDAVELPPAAESSGWPVADRLPLSPCGDAFEDSIADQMRRLRRRASPDHPGASYDGGGLNAAVARMLLGGSARSRGSAPQWAKIVELAAEAPCDTKKHARERLIWPWLA